jgi:hypothetical protein
MTVIGIDLDNTIIAYDGLFHDLAVRWGLVPADFARHGPADKRAVRDAVRAGSPEGEDHWRRLQAHAYGPQLGRAGLFAGVREVLAGLAADGATLHIVSHKTVRANHHDTGVDLRQAALDFLASWGLVGEGCPVPPERVSFRSSRAEKCAVIRELGCRVFVDDLPEVLDAPEFPRQTAAILFDPEGGQTDANQGKTRIRCRTWSEVDRAIRRLCHLGNLGGTGGLADRGNASA